VNQPSTNEGEGGETVALTIRHPQLISTPDVVTLPHDADPPINISIPVSKPGLLFTIMTLTSGTPTPYHSNLLYPTSGACTDLTASAPRPKH